jgi:hypothetical protein
MSPTPRKPIFRAEALRRRARRSERPAPPSPVPSARSIRLLWALLAISIAALAVVGRSVAGALALAGGLR